MGPLAELLVPFFGLDSSAPGSRNHHRVCRPRRCLIYPFFSVAKPASWMAPIEWRQRGIRHLARVFQDLRLRVISCPTCGTKQVRAERTR